MTVFLSSIANKQSLPLAMVPQGCGYNMLGNSVSFVLIVPYSGCHMLHQVSFCE